MHNGHGNGQPKAAAGVFTGSKEAEERAREFEGGAVALDERDELPRGDNENE